MNWPFFRNRHRFHELEVVRLRGLYTAPEGTLSPDAVGTIVYRHKAGEAYEVEFTEPFAAVVTLKGDELSALDG